MAKLRTFLFLCYILFWQSPLVLAQAGKWVLKADDDTHKAIPEDVRYEYQGFVPGTVYYKDKGFSKASFNLNLFSGQMQFISPQGDTLDVADVHLIKLIAIGADTFYLDNGCLKLIEGNAVAKGAKKEKLQIANLHKLNSKGKPDFIGNLTLIRTLNDRGNISNLTEGIEITIVKRTTYFISHNNDKFAVFNKKNVYRLFGKQEALLNSYFAGNDVDFNSEADLQKIVRLLGNL